MVDDKIRRAAHCRDRREFLQQRLRVGGGCADCNGTGFLREEWNSSEKKPWVRGCGRCGGTGDQFVGAVDLAAYCGDPDARAVVGRCLACGSLPVRRVDTATMLCVACGEVTPRGAHLTPWLAALPRWGFTPVVIALQTSAMLRLPRSCCPTGCPACVWKTETPNARSLIEAAGAWVAEPSDARREECARLLADLLAKHDYTAFGLEEDGWWFALPAYVVTVIPSSAALGTFWINHIVTAVGEEETPGAVVGAIKRALIEWALR